MKHIGITLSLAAALIAQAAWAQQSTVDQRLDELQQQIKDLQHQRDLDRQAADAALTNRPAPSPSTSFVRASQEGFYVQSDNGDFVLRIRGYAQADGRFFLDGNQSGTDTFLIRRA